MADSTPERATAAGFVPCSFDCRLCDAAGVMSAWQHAGETNEESAARQSRDVRDRCLAGCSFTATALPEGLTL